MIANELSLQLQKPKSPNQQNLTKSEKLAMAELKQAKNTIIKPADKGSSVVILNRDDYILEAKRQLSDTNFYQKVDSDLTQTHWTQITSLVTAMYNQGEISEQCYKYLTGYQPTPASKMSKPTFWSLAVIPQPISSKNTEKNFKRNGSTVCTAISL